MAEKYAKPVGCMTAAKVNVANRRYWAGPSADCTMDEHLGFKKLEHKIAAKGEVSDPAAVAAAVGRKKLGEAEMARRSAAGRK